MAIDLTSGNGLFDRLGKLGHLLNTINARFGGSSAGDFPTEFNDFVAKYDGASNTLRLAIDGLQTQFESFQTSPDALREALSTAAQNTLIEMADADNPLPSRTVEAALDELIAQMTSGSQDVDASVPSVAVAAAGGNVGDAVMISTVKLGSGAVAENALGEDIVLAISANSTAGNESGTMSGEAAVTANKLDHRWPSGSGSDQTITARDPSGDGFLTNGDFELFTANDPDSWAIDTGVAGTDIKEDTADQYRGTKCLEFDGDGATLSAISQDLSSASLVSRTPYPVSLRIKADVVPAAGNLIVDLYDGASVINDDRGNANSLSIDLTAITTSFAAKTAVFRLPEPVPDTVSIRVRLSTAISAGSSVFVDDLILGPAMTQMYSGGPFVALIRGATDLALGDTFTATVTNAREGAFQELFDKLFGFPEKLLPSDTGGTETIADTLIG